jgi:hypothetical protein
MKKIYILLTVMIIGSVMFAQQYSSKMNAKRGISVETKNVQPETSTNGSKVTFFSEDFEGGDLATAGWTSIDNDGDGNEWSFMCAYTNPHGGSCNAASASYSGGVLTPDNYLISPAIDLSTASGTVFLEWFVAAQDQTWPSEFYEVRISTSGTAVANFSNLVHSETVLAAGPEPNDYWERSVDISSYAGGTIYVAFVHTNCTDMFRINIDDVSVYENTVIDAGLTAITAPSNASTCALTATESVTITVFNYGGSAITGFPVTYSVNGGTPVTETVTASVAPASSYDYTFTQTADLSALDYYTISANVGLTGDSDGSNDNISVDVASTDAYIDVQVQTDSQGGQAWEILNTSNDIVGDHGAYQWNITETTRVCVIDNDCYTFDWYGGTSNTVTVSYNGTQVDQTTATGDYSVYAIGGNCNALDAKLDALTFPAYELPSTNVNITGTVMNIGSNAITSFDVDYTIDGGASVGTYNVTGVNIATGQTYDFTHNVPFNQAVEATYDVEVTISNVNGGTDADMSNNVLSQNILITTSLMQRTVVWEEFSTESCPNCPPVIDNMLAYEATQPNMIMMLHHSGYYTDFLTITESESPGIMDFFNDGGATYAPAGMGDRYYNGLDNDNDGTNDPGPVFWPGSGYGEAYIDAKAQDPAFVSVGITGTYNQSSGALSCTVSGDFLTDFTETVGVSLWVIEDNIQEQSQSGATSTPWIHQHNVRAVISDVWGDEITSATTAGSTYSKNYTYTMDGSWVDAELYLVAFVNTIDAADVNNREIHNASKVQAINIQVDVEDNYVVEDNIHMYPNPTTGLVKFLNVKNAQIEVFNMLGQQMISVDSNNSYSQLDLSQFENGTYVVKVTTENNVMTTKIVLEK